MKTLILASIMCPSFCVDEPPPLDEICDTSPSGAGMDSFPILPIPLAQFDHSGGINFHPRLPRMPEIPNNPFVPYPPTIHPLPENPPTAVVPEPSSLAIMGLVDVIGLLTMRKKGCPVD